MSSNLKLIMSVSGDNYFCAHASDDMSWTGPWDKKAFALLTCTEHGICGAGAATYKVMPPLLRGREIYKISRTPSRDADTISLSYFKDLAPHGWILGGPTFAKALFLTSQLGEIILCKNIVNLKNKFGELDKKYEASWLINGLMDSQLWRIGNSIMLGDVLIQFWRRSHG